MKNQKFVWSLCVPSIAVAMMTGLLMPADPALAGPGGSGSHGGDVFVCKYNASWSKRDKVLYNIFQYSIGIPFTIVGKITEMGVNQDDVFLADTFDLFFPRAWDPRQRPPIQKYRWMPEERFMSLALGWINEENPELAVRLKAHLQELNWVWVNELEELDDDDIKFIPKGCKKRQVAIQNMKTGEVRANVALYGKLSLIERSFLKLHEAFIKDEMPLAEEIKNTQLIRDRVNGLAGSGELLTVLDHATWDVKSRTVQEIYNLILLNHETKKKPYVTGYPFLDRDTKIQLGLLTSEYYGAPLPPIEEAGDVRYDLSNLNRRSRGYYGREPTHYLDSYVYLALVLTFEKHGAKYRSPLGRKDPNLGRMWDLLMGGPDPDFSLRQLAKAMDVVYVWSGEELALPSKSEGGSAPGTQAIREQVSELASAPGLDRSLSQASWDVSAKNVQNAYAYFSENAGRTKPQYLTSYQHELINALVFRLPGHRLPAIEDAADSRFELTPDTTIKPRRIIDSFVISMEKRGAAYRTPELAKTARDEFAKLMGHGYFTLRDLAALTDAVFVWPE